MRNQKRHFHHILALLSLWIFVAIPTTAQQPEDLPAPQFLYRDNDQLILLDGYTGEPTPLAIDVSPGDRFGWSPDGQFLITWLQDSETETSCLNLYKVDEQAWLSDDPIACPVERIKFSNDGQQLFYVVPDEYNATLWRYNLTEQTKQELYRTTGGNSPNDTGISDLALSPTGAYLTFESFDWMMGGTMNAFVILNTSTLEHAVLQAPDTYYASYYPIWSPDDSWFLINMMDEYVVSATLPQTSHRGDVYLVNSDTGESYRLTFTPAEVEKDIHWIDEGNIAYTRVIEEVHMLSIDEAINIEPIPSEEIIMPDVTTLDEDNTDSMPYGVMPSPNPNIGAWVDDVEPQPILTIGEFHWSIRTPYFSVPITDSSQDTLIGWRPSKIAYPRG
ncbi:MAG: hypothetical protein KC708_22950 [Anaerolineae bacterium]|nr:hypothetical protein [Anaerolineae bacterium]